MGTFFIFKSSIAERLYSVLKFFLKKTRVDTCRLLDGRTFFTFKKYSRPAVLSFENFIFFIFKNSIAARLYSVLKCFLKRHVLTRGSYWLGELFLHLKQYSRPAVLSFENFILFFFIFKNSTAARLYSVLKFFSKDMCRHVAPIGWEKFLYTENTYSRPAILGFEIFIFFIFKNSIAARLDSVLIFFQKDMCWHVAPIGWGPFFYI